MDPEGTSLVIGFTPCEHSCMDFWEAVETVEGGPYWRKQVPGSFLFSLLLVLQGSFCEPPQVPTMSLCLTVSSEAWSQVTMETVSPNSFVTMETVSPFSSSFLPLSWFSQQMFFFKFTI